MSADLYAAWLTAGNNLQSVGAWLAGDGAWVPIFALAAAVLLVVCWALRGDDYRTRNDHKQAAWLVVCTPRTEPAEPGTDDELLAACNQICPDLARKEKP
ncbi:hypothetical protein M2155_000658 [Streptomyces sp. SAI-119]|uniref:hypothetical protein n=1 Tax=Streptomyces sp. SAI-119 TaxID=2940541 RepID=UPI002475C82B|nr:hypothetical protein [Streptomyces sp. SAI-119]MDH6448250.1 hypothetical protein [Streptomyces sp. SAI-119]